VHYLADYLSENNKVLFINPLARSKNQKKANIELWSPSSFRLYCNKKNKDKKASNKKTNNTIISKTVRKIRLMQLKKKINSFAKTKEKYVVFQFPYYIELISFLKKNGFNIIYDCIDDIKLFKSISKKNIKDEETLIKNSNKIIVTSKYLKNKIKKKNTSLISNGANLKLFKTSRKNKKRPLDLPNNNKKNIGYFGAIE
jgi:hypothetical protein